jgi:glycine/D-amino acid oxidase-like deaminating enzyme
MREDESTWEADVERRGYPAHRGRLDVDVAIVGGGIAGLSAAYRLARDGRRVAVLEKGRIAGSASGLTTAFITRALDTDARDLIETSGADFTRDLLRSHQRAIDAIEATCRDERIDCAFTRCPLYLYANGPEELEAIAREYRALRDLGAEAVFSPEPAAGFRNAGFLAIPEQAKFHPLRYLLGLAEAAVARGASIFEQSEVVAVDGDGPFEVKTDGGAVRAAYVVSATNHPYGEPARLFFQKGFYVTYMLELTIETDALAEGIYEDTANPYRYFRVDPESGGRQRVIIGGEDHRRDIHVDPEKNFAALEEYATERFGPARGATRRRWIGPILEPADGLAYIGPLGNPKMIYATAFSGNGMTYGAIAGRLIADLVAGRANPDERLYRARRVPPFRRLWVKGRDYLGELWGGAIHNALRRGGGR